MAGLFSRGPFIVLLAISLFLTTIYILRGDTSFSPSSSVLLRPQSSTTSTNPSSSSPSSSTSNLYDPRYGRPAATAPSISKQIWQIFFSPPAGTGAIPADTFKDVASWPPMAPDWTYTLIGDAGGSEFVDAHFGADRPDIVATYRALGNGTALFPNSNHHNNNHKKNLALKSDFLRYLLLFVRGGVYSDLDTRPLAPLGEWVEVRAAPVRLVVAVEYDSPVLGPTEAYPVQFGQWTIAAAAGHPVLACMIERALAGLRDLGLLAGDDDSSSSPSPSAPPATPAQAQAGENAVYNATGPIGWTECVMDGIRRTLEHPERFRHANLSGIAGPRYFGDIVVLPDGAFAAALPPGSPEPGNGDRVGLVSHAFRGVWKHP